MGQPQRAAPGFVLHIKVLNPDVADWRLDAAYASRQDRFFLPLTSLSPN